MQTIDAHFSQAAAGYVQWINTFPNISQPCHEISDLSDGVVLFEILHDIDPRWFKLSRVNEAGENWVLRVDVLRRLYKLLMRFYEEVLGQPTQNLDAPNLNAIAKDGDVEELCKLMQLIVAMAVQCAKNQEYIEKIQELSPVYQQLMMVAIEQVMARLAPTSEDELEAGGAREASKDENDQFDFNEQDEQLLRLRSELNKVRAEKEELIQENRELSDEHNNLRQNYDELMGEREEYKLRVRELERALGQANETGKGEFLMRAEIENLKLDLDKKETRLDEAERLVDEQSTTISELNRKMEQLTRKAEQAGKLKDQLQEYKHAAEKLQKAEMAVEKYKKKLDESNEIRKQVKTLEEQNQLLSEKLASTEDEYRRVTVFKPMVEQYKVQVGELQAKVDQMRIEHIKLEYDIRRYQEKFTLMEIEKNNDQNQIGILEDRVRELEFGSIDIPAPQTPGGSRLPNAQAERTTFELRSRITQLEREIDSLRHSRSQEGADQRVLLLENMLDDANRLKDQFEQEYIASKKQYMLLENELNRLRNGVDHDLSLTLRQRLNESEEALADAKKKLAENEVALEESRKELIVAKSNLLLVDKDRVDALNQIRAEAAGDMEELLREHAALKLRVSELETELGQRVESMNQLLVENSQLQSIIGTHKDQLLESEKAAAEIRTAASQATATANTELETVRAQLTQEQRRTAQLNQQITELQAQLQALQVKMQKAKEFIRQQDRLFKETRSEAETKGGNFSEAVESLQAANRALEEELGRVESKYTNMEQNWRRERDLICAAWFDMARRIQRDGSTRGNGALGAAPGATGSWLSSQRRATSIHTKRP